MNYSKLNKSQLLDLAMERDIAVDETMTNEAIVKLLQNTDESVTEAEDTETDEEVEVPVVETKKPSVKVETMKLYAEDDELIAQLKKEPVVSVFIQRERGEPENTTQPVILNGVQFNITKGVIVQCPQSIAEIVNYAILKQKNAELEMMLLE